MIATIPPTNRITEAPEIDPLEHAWFRTAVESIAQSLRQLAEVGPELTTALALNRKHVATESQALAVLIELGTSATVSKVADRLCVHRSTLYRWPKFMDALSRIRTGGRGVRMAGSGKGGAE